MFSWTKGLTGKPKAPSAYEDFTTWRQGAGVSDETFNSLDANSIAGLHQAHNTTPIDTTGSWFGKDGYLANGAQIADALSGLAGAYTGYKNYQLAQDQFDAEQKYAAANLYNQGTLVNNQIENAAKVGQSLAGDTMTADQKAAQLTGLASKYVKTAV